MKKTILSLNIILTLLILAGDIAYILTDQLWVKSITSAGFVLIGAINLFYVIKNKSGNLKFPITLLIGLVFAMLGDILLEIEFIVGAGLFAVGHVFYFSSYCFLQRFKISNIIASACVLIPSILIITLVPIFDFGGVLMQMVCIVYAVVISGMLGKAISNFIKEKNTLNLLILIGSALFFFSDFMLLFNVFADISRVFGVLCLATYYPANIVLGFSLLYYKK